MNARMRDAAVTEDAGEGHMSKDFAPPPSTQLVNGHDCADDPRLGAKQTEQGGGLTQITKNIKN